MPTPERKRLRRQSEWCARRVVAQIYAILVSEFVREILAVLFRRLRGDDFFEARVAPKRERSPVYVSLCDWERLPLLALSIRARMRQGGRDRPMKVTITLAGYRLSNLITTDGHQCLPPAIAALKYCDFRTLCFERSHICTAKDGITNPQAQL